MGMLIRLISMAPAEFAKVRIGAPTSDTLATLTMTLILTLAAVAATTTATAAIPNRAFTEGNWKAATMTVEMSKEEFRRWWKTEVSETQAPKLAVEFEDVSGSCASGPKARPELRKRDNFDYRLKIFSEPLGADEVRVRTEMWIFRFRTPAPQSTQAWQDLQQNCLATLMKRDFEGYAIKARGNP
jgi:hypothetical protein